MVQAARKENEEWPQATNTLKKEIYMVDGMSGGDSDRK